MQLKGYQVWISSDGKSLPEYSVQHEGGDGKTIACFIPSESGKTFSIEWRDHVGHTHLRLITKVDGQAVGGNRCRPGGKGVRWGVRTSTTTRQPFQFAPLQTTDDEENVNSLAPHAALGQIEVSVVRIRAEYRSVPHTMGRFQPVGAVHERSKKAGVHCVSLGANRQVPLSKTQSSSTPLNPREGSVAKFIFRYRPTGLLQAQGIIPLPVADIKPVHPDRKIKKRPSDEVNDLADVPVARPFKRLRQVHVIEEEDVKPSILQVNLSVEEDAKPVLVKTCSSDEEEEELVEADIVKVDCSDEDEEAESEEEAEQDVKAEGAKERGAAKAKAKVKVNTKAETKEEEETEEKDDDDEEDLEQIQSQIELLQEKFARAVERKATRGSQALCVKEEPGPGSQLSGVVIDLTLDEDDD